jgi:outer membrane immunogenic protein
MDFFGTVRGRLGYVFDRTLVYATGGFAFGDVNNTVNFFGPAGQLQFTGSTDNVETGYTVGGGIEHAFAPNWSVKAEYLFYDLGRNTVNVAVVPGSGGGGTGYNSTFSNEGHIARIGLNYKFGPM